jgi:hypothetical protein
VRNCRDVPGVNRGGSGSWWEEDEMDDALVAYNAGRVDGAAGYRDPQIAEDPEVGADYRVGVLDGRIAAFHLIMEVRRILGVEGSLFERPDDVTGS